jgi:hypothetical protein
MNTFVSKDAGHKYLEVQKMKTNTGQYHIKTISNKSSKISLSSAVLFGS